MAFEGKGLGDLYSGTSAMLLRAKISVDPLGEHPAPLITMAPCGQERAGFELSIFCRGCWHFFFLEGGETLKSRFIHYVQSHTALVLSGSERGQIA